MSVNRTLHFVAVLVAFVACPTAALADDSATVRGLHGEATAMVKTPSGGLLLASQIYHEHPQDRDYTQNWIAKLDRSGRPVKSFGRNGVIRFTTRGIAAQPRFAVGTDGAVTVALVNYRRAGYYESFEELHLMRFKRSGAPDRSFGPGGVNKMMRTREGLDRFLDPDLLSLAVDADQNAYVIANEYDFIHRVHSFSPNGKLRTAYRERTRDAFRRFKYINFNYSRIEQVTPDGELLVSGYGEPGGTVPLTERSWTALTTSQAILIGTDGNYNKSFGSGGMLRVPQTTWAHNRAAAIRLTTAGLTTITDEDHPYTIDPPPAKGLKYAFMKRWRVRSMTREGADLPYVGSDAEGGRLALQPADLTDSFVEDVAISANGTAAVLRAHETNSIFQLTAVSPNGTVQSGAPFNTHFSSATPIVNLLKPESGEVLLLGCPTKKCSRLILKRFRAIN